jgi:Fe2+ transport system protein FeoA
MFGRLLHASLPASIFVSVFLDRFIAKQYDGWADKQLAYPIGSFAMLHQPKTRNACLHCESCLVRMRAELARRKELHAAAEELHLTLASLEVGQHAAIVDIAGEDQLHKRLIDMGVTPGTPVEVERVAPLGDPIDVRIRGYHLSLRKREAERIAVELR